LNKREEGWGNMKTIVKLFLSAVILLGLTANASADSQINTKMNLTGDKTQIIMDMLDSPSVNFKLYHLVKPGDTLWWIAKQYDTTVQELATENELDADSQLVVNQRLAIPIDKKGSKSTKDTSDKVNVYVVVDQTQSHHYQVKKGDALSKIAKKYGVSVDYLMKLNHLKSGQPIIIGQTLRY
jgi:LysM repeat protein